MPVNPQQKGAMVHRYTLFVMFVGVMVAVLVVRLWFLQVVQGDRYRVMAEGNRIREVPLEASRGKILDRNGQMLVGNRWVLSIVVLPTEFEKLEDKEGEVARLAGMLGMKPEEIMRKLEGNEVQPHKPVLIKKDVDPEVYFFIAERQVDFPWVEADEMPVREYYEGEETLAAHVLGYLGEISKEQLEALKDKGYKAGDIVGTSGVEAYYEDTLRGIDGKRIVEVDAYQPRSEAVQKFPRRGPSHDLPVMGVPGVVPGAKGSTGELLEKPVRFLRRGNLVIVVPVLHAHLDAQPLGNPQNPIEREKDAIKALTAPGRAHRGQRCLRGPGRRACDLARRVKFIQALCQRRAAWNFAQVKNDRSRLHVGSALNCFQRIPQGQFAFAFVFGGKKEGVLRFGCQVRNGTEVVDAYHRYSGLPEEPSQAGQRFRGQTEVQLYTFGTKAP